MKARYLLNLDLDGVLFDFERGVKEMFGKEITEYEPRRLFWEELKSFQETGGEFFYHLELLPGAKELFEEVMSHEGAMMLSATGHIHPDLSRQQKTRAVVKHFGNEYHSRVIFTRKGADKHTFINPDLPSILIDDRNKAIDPWIEAGGIGILHTDVDSTLIELHKILTNLDLK